jgi:hypothetical protein
VADEVASRIGLQEEGFGTLMVVSVEVFDCRAERVAPNIDRCWHVGLHYETGSMSRIATREADTGDIEVSQ